MSELVMPRLSDTMEEGTILRWLKAEGEQVARGEELVEIETDKATMTYESDQEGVLEILAPEGSTLAVGEPIARVGAADAATAAASEADSDDKRPASGGQAGERSQGEHATPPSAQAPAAATLRAPAGGETGERVKASPLARRMAREGGISLHGLSGSGPGGRIVKADVERVSQAAEDDRGTRPGARAGSDADAADHDATPVPVEGVTTAKGETTTVELSRTQQTIARRMAESKATIPDFSLQCMVDMEDCVSLRGELKRLAPNEGASSEAQTQGEVPTYNDMVVKACALALREHPRANASYRDGRLQLHSRINVGVAVAADGALIVPTVFDAEEKSLGEIARETRALAERVREATITPSELGGGTFTVSNLGMFGVSSFAAIINPPQAAILSVGTLAPRAVVRDGAVMARNTMTLTLVCDHRILYGAEAAQFLKRIREILEAPSSLTL